MVRVLVLYDIHDVHHLHHRRSCFSRCPLVALWKLMCAEPHRALNILLKKYTIFLRNNSTVVCLKILKSIYYSMKKSPAEKQKFQKFDMIIQNTHVT